MLSILIPVYNYNVLSLVQSLHTQVCNSEHEFEIICLDDASSIKYNDNLKINSLSNCKYIFLENNIGRSAIRNKLAELSKYELLLFIDSDMEVTNTNYITKYLQEIDNNDIVYGGITYAKTLSDERFVLRWKYGTYRESLSVEKRIIKPYLSAKFCNLLIRKKVFESVRFDESIKEYGHEDTLYSIHMQELNLKVKHIENEIIHLGLEDSKTYMNKVKVASINLRNIYELHANNQLLLDIPLLKTYILLKRYRLFKLYQLLYKIVGNGIERNLLSKDPNIMLLDFYKLNSIGID